MTTRGPAGRGAELGVGDGRATVGKRLQGPANLVEKAGKQDFTVIVAIEVLEVGWRSPFLPRICYSFPKY